MSYILDALKRADAERERGRVPGLHSQPGPTQPPATPRTSAQGPARRMALTAAGLLLAVAAAAFWWFKPAGDAPAAVPPPAQQAPNPPPLAPTPAPPALLSTAPEPVAPLLVPEPQAAAPQAPAPKPAQPSGAALRRLSDLPPEQRGQVPPLNVNGASHSANPAHRLLIVNGAVLQEGQQVVPGLTLERIGAREAVFNHQGLRFTVGY